MFFKKSTAKIIPSNISLTCSECGFCSKNDVFIYDDTSLCNICFDYDNLLSISDNYYLIWLPEISQIMLNNLVRTITFLNVKKEEFPLEWENAKQAYKDLLERKKDFDKIIDTHMQCEISKFTIDIVLGVLNKNTNETEKEVYKKGLRLLPHKINNVETWFSHKSTFSDVSIEEMEKNDFYQMVIDRLVFDRVKTNKIKEIEL